MFKKKKPVVVIIGGGYAGVRAALDLGKKTRVDIVLIDEKPYHALPTQLYELASIYREEKPLETKKQKQEVFHKLLYSVVVPFSEIFQNMPQVEHIEGVAIRVDQRSQDVILQDGRAIAYDWLVIATGSRTNYFGIPHLEANSIGLKSPEDALNIRNRIDELFLKSPKHKHIRVVIGGGGLTGTELAGELGGYMRTLARIHARPVSSWSCMLIEAKDSLLPASPTWIQEKAHERLSKLGVTIITKSPIVDVWPGLLYVGNDKKAIHHDLLVWTAGVMGRCDGDIVKTAHLGKNNCVEPDDHLAISASQNVFVAGDIAASSAAPMSAQKAIQEGAYVAKLIARRITNPHAKFPQRAHKRSGFIIPIGGKFALLETRWIRARGYKVWLLKQYVLFRYLHSILPLRKAFSFTFRDVRLFTKNDA